MPELLRQIETLNDAELEQLIAAARAQLEQRHEAPPLEESERQLLVERALRAKENGFPGRPAEEALDELEHGIKQRAAAKR